MIPPRLRNHSASQFSGMLRLYTHLLLHTHMQMAEGGASHPRQIDRQIDRLIDRQIDYRQIDRQIDRVYKKLTFFASFFYLFVGGRGVFRCWGICRRWRTIAGRTVSPRPGGSNCQAGGKQRNLKNLFQETISDHNYFYFIYSNEEVGTR